MEGKILTSYNVELSELLTSLSSDAEKGLSSSAALELLEKHGENKLKEKQDNLIEKKLKLKKKKLNSKKKKRN